jgi:DNA-binding NarL/FixJ family response regulator
MFRLKFACGVPILVLIVGMVSNLETVLSHHPDWEVCGEVTDSKQTVGQILKLWPDLVVLNMGAPAADRLECIQEVRRIAPTIKLLLVSYASYQRSVQYVVSDLRVSEDLECLARS